MESAPVSTFDRYRNEIRELVSIAQLLTSERNPDKLLPMILERARVITHSDAGSIYVVERDKADVPHLRFKTSQNDSIDYPAREFTLPISNRSITGFVAISKKTLAIDDVYKLPPDAPYSFDRSFDARMLYRSKSMLVVPMISAKQETIGVVQLINRKREPGIILRNEEDFRDAVIPYDEWATDLLETLSVEAAIALENALLYEEINNIFAGFVMASVEAIEQRDPTTSGHSRRVALLTVSLAESVNRYNFGPLGDINFSSDQLREIEIASLLHDFGKIGVREQVLLKAKKLFPHELDAIYARLQYAKRAAEIAFLDAKCRILESAGSRADIDAQEQRLHDRIALLSRAWDVIVAANEPTILSSDCSSALTWVAEETVENFDGQWTSLISPSELACLRIPRGSLNAQELEEIRSHVRHTRKFLSQIPWGRAFRNVPDIAGSHHEKLGGDGYPNRLNALEIPVQAKMMAICDIYDALTASDRPYKRAVPTDRAIDILRSEVKGGALDENLFEVFCDGQVYRAVERDAPAPHPRLA